MKANETMTWGYKEQGEVMIPDLKLPEQKDLPLGKYAMMRLDFLKTHRKGIYTTLVSEARLTEHLYEIEQTAKKQLSESISRQAMSLGVTEELKAKNQMKWVQMMNNIKNSAERNSGQPDLHLKIVNPHANPTLVAEPIKTR